MKIKICFIVTLLSFNVTLFGQRSDYHRAKRANSLNSYATFLKKYPESKLAEKAKLKKAELCNMLLRSNSLEDLLSRDPDYFYQVIENCPEADNIVPARRLKQERESKKEDEHWETIVESDNVYLLEGFKTKYPNSKYLSQIHDKIETLDWNEANKARTKEDVVEFLKKYPNSKRLKTADSLLLEIKADSILIAAQNYPLVMAARAGNIEEVNALVMEGANDELKSRALMEAVWGALFTTVGVRNNVNAYGSRLYAKRTAEKPREVYIEIITFLIEHNANPNLFSFKSFNSENARQKMVLDELVAQLPGYAESHSDLSLSEREVIKLIPYGSGGISLIDVSIIHEASDILALIGKIPATTIDNFYLSGERVGIFSKGITVSDIHQMIPTKQIKKKIGYRKFEDDVYDDYEIHDSKGKKILILTPEHNGDVNSKIHQITILDNRFKTADNIGLDSTFGELKKNYTIDKISIDEEGVFFHIGALKAEFNINKTELMEEWWDGGIDKLKIPDVARFNEIIIWWR